MKNKLYILIVSLTLLLLVRCGDDDKVEFVKGNTTELKTKVVASYDLINNASLVEYKQNIIDEFKSKVDIVNSVIASDDVSEQEVINMTVHLDKATAKFLNSKMIAIDLVNLIAGWSFNEGSGTELTADGSKQLVAKLKTGPSEIFGSATGLPRFIKEKDNFALDFKDGAHLAIEEYNPSDFLSSKFSISVWLKPRVTKGGNYVASLNYWENWKLQIQEQGKPFFTIKTTNGVLDADNERDQSVKPGSWSHVVISLDLDTKTMKMFINGGDDADGGSIKEWTDKERPALSGRQVPPYQSLTGKTLPLLIGASTTYENAQLAWSWAGWNTPSGWDYFDGLMDEVKFYNVALTDGQVSWLYNKEVSLFK